METQIFVCDGPLDNGEYSTQGIWQIVIVAEHVRPDVLRTVISYSSPIFLLSCVSCPSVFTQPIANTNQCDMTSLSHAAEWQGTSSAPYPPQLYSFLVLCYTLQTRPLQTLQRRVAVSNMHIPDYLSVAWYLPQTDAGCMWGFPVRRKLCRILRQASLSRSAPMRFTGERLYVLYLSIPPHKHPCWQQSFLAVGIGCPRADRPGRGSLWKREQATVSSAAISWDDLIMISFTVGNGWRYPRFHPQR